MASSHGEIRDYGDKEYKVIGTRPIRHDGTDKVTGRAVYGGDVQLPGMLYGQVLRSPHGHARIRSIDTSRAEALEGVRAVVTGMGDLPPTEGDEIVDLGEGPAKLKYMRDNVLATDKVLYRGHAVAGVAATASSASAVFGKMPTPMMTRSAANSLPSLHSTLATLLLPLNPVTPIPQRMLTPSSSCIRV